MDHYETSTAPLEYTLNGAPDQAYLSIRDMQGREIVREPVSRSEGQVVWDTRAVAPGTYTVELMNRGIAAGSIKIVVKQ